MSENVGIDDTRSAQPMVGPDLPKKVAVVYSHVRRSDFPTEAQYITEKDAEQDAG